MFDEEIQEIVLSFVGVRCIRLRMESDMSPIALVSTCAGIWRTGPEVRTVTQI
jgi:hypothetical protein